MKLEERKGLVILVRYDTSRKSSQLKMSYLSYWRNRWIVASQRFIGHYY